MAHLYFHCTNSSEVLPDMRGRELDSLGDAQAEAVEIARLVMACATGLTDFRDWLIHVEDDEGDEVMVLPFTFVRARAH
jgi:hypothetical protein